MTPASRRRPPGRTRIAPRTADRTEGGTFDIDRMLDDRSVEIIVCCGSGGVGKTTTAAAVA
jgi:flagellar biosynthesis GTPase FlhF